MRPKLPRPHLGAAALMATSLFATAPAFAQKQEVVEIATRNQRARALLLKPQNPAGSIILLAGGHGNLALGKDGAIGWGAGNQVVRTRSNYAKAGFATLVPDIAPTSSRAVAASHGIVGRRPTPRDIGAYVAYMRSIAAPVYLGRHQPGGALGCQSCRRAVRGAGATGRRRHHLRHAGAHLRCATLRAA